LLCDSGLVAMVCKWDDSMRELHSVTTQGENRRCDRNWLYLTMILLKALS
jgi:hypothetical protein